MAKEIKFPKFINSNCSSKTGSSAEHQDECVKWGKHEPLNEVFNITKENGESTTNEWGPKVMVHFYGAVCRASEAPRFSVQRYFEEVSFQLALEEFERRLGPNDGGKVVPDGRRSIGEASIDDGWSVYWLVKMNCGGWTKVVGNMTAVNELVEIGRVGCG